MQKINDFISNLTNDDIDLCNKLNNLCESGELANEMLFDIIYYNERISNAICNQIRHDVINYKMDIIEETEQLYNIECITDKYDYSSGLYNMDKLYIEAIRKVFDLDYDIYVDDNF